MGRLLQQAAVLGMLERYPRPVVVAAIQEVLEALRGELRTAARDLLPEDSELEELILAAIGRRQTASLKRVINASGVVIHTNLGRAPLAEEALQAIHGTAAGYSNLEFDLESGERGSRLAHVEALLCRLTGAEAALVVNNNAAAVMLALGTLASGHEVVVSRGELVEIGGAFRIPDVMAQSGARLVEVGTTNRTHPRDYAAAVSEATALLLKVHASNYAVIGFTAEVGLPELAQLGKQHGIPVMLDAGSGCLINLAPYGICGEVPVSSYLTAGADLVTFSGDKLLGGPQAGIIVGSKVLLAAMKRNPLLRAMRIDKLSLAALEATLRLYSDERIAVARIPTLRMLCMPAAEIQRRAGRIVRYLRRRLSVQLRLRLMHGESSVGGGAFPLLQLPSTLIVVERDGMSPNQLERALLRAKTPVIGRIQRNSFLLDVRTIQDDDLPLLAAALNTLQDESAKGSA